MKIKFNSLENNIAKPISNLLRNFSPSKFIEYKECPKAFYYKHIAKIQLPEKKIHLLFGEAFHKAFDDLLDDKTLLESKKEFSSIFAIDKLANEEKPNHQKLFEIGLMMLDKINNEIPILNLKYGIKNNCLNEQWLECILEDPFTKEKLTLPIKGKADKIVNDEDIWEVKTSSGKWNENDIKYKWQTMFYGWTYFILKGRHPKNIRYLIVTKQKTPQIQILEANYTLDDYSKLFTECKNIINKIELGIYDKTEEWHPKYCSCYEYEKLLNN